MCVICRGVIRGCPDCDSGDRFDEYPLDRYADGAFRLAVVALLVGATALAIAILK